jgi:hypothetical protein
MVATGTAFARPVGWRLFVTVWLVYSIFATTNVVRETYLAISLAERFSVRVDPYRDLHPDLFEVPGRGWYVNSNPGTSIIGAVPYGLFVRPAIALATRLRPEIAAPKPPATYDDPRPNRARFMNAARARGLDMVLGLAALGTAVTLMAPLGALATLLMFLFLRERLGDERRALAWSIAFAFATPNFFRAAFLNQNAILAHLVLCAWILKVGLTARGQEAPPAARTLTGIGLLLGYGLVCDYSAIPFLLVFGVWILADGWRRGGVNVALREAGIYTAGAMLSVLILFGYQWLSFGHALWPAQRYMPPTEYSVKGWFGFTPPAPELLWRNLFDLRYGLFAFCPLLLAALPAPWVRKSGGWRPSPDELLWIGLSFTALLLFSSANQFANLQWNTGVRYMVPAVPLLFLAAVPVLNALPRVARWTIVGMSFAISFAVSMTREDVPTALGFLASEGPTLPILLTLERVASGYANLQLPGASFWLVAGAVGLVLAVIWRPVWRTAGRQPA